MKKRYLVLSSILAAIIGTIGAIIFVPWIVPIVFYLTALPLFLYILHLTLLSIVPKKYSKAFESLKSFLKWAWPWKGKKKSAPSTTVTFRHQATTKTVKSSVATTPAVTSAPKLPEQPVVPAVSPKAENTVAKPKGAPSKISRGISVKPVIRVTYPTREISDSWIASRTKLGGGGEAVVLEDESTASSSVRQAIKIFRLPDDEYYEGADMAAERKGAKERLDAYTEKLSQFPPWLSSRVIAPTGIITRKEHRHQVSGYSMPLVENSNPLVRYANPKWKSKNKITLTDIALIFRDLYDTVQEMHACGMVIGDFKPANVLVQNHKAFIVDAESAAFGDFPCRTFTEAYVDPRICNQKLDYLMIAAPYDRLADWYSFTVMLFKCLTNISPWDGSYSPPKGRAPVSPGERPLKRISVFNKHVTVPNFTGSISSLPQDLQNFFYQVFESGLRGKPDRKLIESLIPEKKRWYFSPTKHTAWARYQLNTVSGENGPELQLKAKETPAGVLYAYRRVGRDILTLNYHEGVFFRESGKEILKGKVDEYNHFDVGVGFTVVGKDQSNHSNIPAGIFEVTEIPGETYDGPFYVIPEEGKAQMIKYVDPAWDGCPNFVIQRDTIFWVHQGEMYSLKGGGCDKKTLIKFNGSVKIFSGSNFGLAFTTVGGELGDVYCFTRTSVSRLVSLPPIMGNIQTIKVEFSPKRCWVFIAAEWEGENQEYVLVLDKGHSLLGMGQLLHGMAPWLFNGSYFVAVDEGVEKDEKGNFEANPKLAVFHDSTVSIFTVTDSKVVVEGTATCDITGYCGVVYHNNQFRGLLPVSVEETSYEVKSKVIPLSEQQSKDAREISSEPVL